MVVHHRAKSRLRGHHVCGVSSVIWLLILLREVREGLIQSVQGSLLVFAHVLQLIELIFELNFVQRVHRQFIVLSDLLKMFKFLLQHLFLQFQCFLVFFLLSETFIFFISSETYGIASTHIRLR